MATVTVGPSGKDYTTIEAAIAGASINDTIDIYNGTYNIPAGVTITPKNGQTVKAADGQASVVIDGSLCNRSDYPVVAMTAVGATLSGVTVQNAKLAAKAGVTLGGSGNTINDCTVQNCEEDGIFGYGATSGTISDCYIYNNATVKNSLTHGIYLSACSNVTVSGNWIRGNSNPGGGMGLHINTGSASPNTGMIVYGNIFDRNGASATRQGVDLMNTHDSQVYNNVFIDNGIKCLSNVPPYSKLYSDENTISNNTFICPNKAKAIELLGPEDGNYDGGRNCVVFNNICITTSSTSAVTDRQTAAGYENTKTRNYTGTYSTLLMDQIFDPSATGWRADNFQLRSNAPATIKGYGARTATDDVAGTKTAPTTDYAGNPRPIPNPGGTWDIGAYQYGADGYSWPYYVIRPSAIGSINEWKWVVDDVEVSPGSEDVTILQRDPDDIYGWDLAALGTYVEGKQNFTNARMRFSLENWNANWPQSGFIVNLRVKFRMAAKNIAAMLQVVLYDGVTAVGYYPNQTVVTRPDGTEIVTQGSQIINIPTLKSLYPSNTYATDYGSICWAEFSVPSVTSTTRYTRFTPAEVSSMELRLAETNPDMASWIRVYGIETECRMAAITWNRTRGSGAHSIPSSVE